MYFTNDFFFMKAFQELINTLENKLPVVPKKKKKKKKKKERCSEICTKSILKHCIL